jgi:hypothetical protein
MAVVAVAACSPAAESVSTVAPVSQRPTVGPVATAVAVPTPSVTPAGPTQRTTPSATIPSTLPVTDSLTHAAKRIWIDSKYELRIKPSLYTGPGYYPRWELIRRCIVWRESNGDYTVRNKEGAAGAYQMTPYWQKRMAKAIGNIKLAHKQIQTWPKYWQDKAFWTLWKNGKGMWNWTLQRRSCGFSR